MFAGNFAPVGWAFCGGQLLALAQNDALFSLFGTTYGGDGQTTFGLPDLRGRVPIHAGTGPGLSPRQLGSSSGVESVTLNPNQLPSHTHALQATSGGGNTRDLPNAQFATSVGGSGYSTGQGRASRAFGVDIEWMAMAARLPLIYLTFLIPTLGNFGTRELTWAALFSEYGERDALIAYAFSINAIFLVLNVVLGILFLSRALELIRAVRQTRRDGGTVPKPLFGDPNDP
jgi:microcystin-dependent protein